MARQYKCKCFITGKEGTTDVFVKKLVGKSHKYFESEEVYSEYIKDKENKEKLRNTVAEILEYKILPPMLIKELNELLLIFNAEVITETFKQQKDTIQYWLGLDGKFNSDFSKVKYMMAIIKNNIIEVDKRWQIEQKRKQPKQVNIDIDMMDIELSSKATNKDISQFL